MPYLITRKDGKNTEVLGIGKLLFISDYPSDGISLVKEGEFTCSGGYQNLLNTELISFNDFGILVDITDIPISHFDELSEHFMLRIIHRDGTIFFLTSLSTGQYKGCWVSERSKSSSLNLFYKWYKVVKILEKGSYKDSFFTLVF